MRNFSLLNFAVGRGESWELVQTWKFSGGLKTFLFVVGRDRRLPIQLKPTEKLPTGPYHMAAIHANVGSLGWRPGLNVYKYYTLFRAESQSSALILIRCINWFQEEKLGKRLAKAQKGNQTIFSHLLIMELGMEEPQPFHDYYTILFVHLFSKRCLSI